MVTPLTIGSVTITNGVATITWSATPGATYRLQWASDAQNWVWVSAAGDVTATGNTASKTDTLGSAVSRFYRVMLVPN
jgi:hypothetical protein